MCGGIHYGEVEGLVSVERWSCNRGASCVGEYTVKIILHPSQNINTCPIDRGKFNTIYVYQEGRRTTQVSVWACEGRREGT